MSTDHPGAGRCADGTRRCRPPRVGAGGAVSAELRARLFPHVRRYRPHCLLPQPHYAGSDDRFRLLYLADEYGQEDLATLRQLSHTGERGGGNQYSYEALNLADGKRTVSDIHDWLTAELGPVPFEYVARYLKALESIGVLERVAP